jgi:hypothetical protein
VSEPTSPAQGSPLERMVRELAKKWERRIAGLEKRGKHWSAPTKKRANEVRYCLAELRAEVAKLPNVSSSAAEPGERSTDVRWPPKPGAVRWSAWLEPLNLEPRSLPEVRAVGSGRSNNARTQ